MSDLLFYIDPPAAEARQQDLRAEERSILDGINRQVAAAASLAEILDSLFSQTGPIAPCDRISLAFVEEDGRRIRSHYTRAAYQPILLGTGYAEDRATSTLVDVIERGRIRIIRDLAAYLDLKPRSPSTRLLVREGVRSSMTCPLTVDGRHVGVLFRSSRAVDAYDLRQAMLHLAIAERLSQAVEKAWRIEQLTAANKAYFEMLGFVAHELKSPLASIVMDIQTILAGYLGDVDDRQKKILARTIGKADYLMALVTDYLNLSRLEGDQMKLRVKCGIDFVKDVLDPTLEILRPQIGKRQMRVVRDIGEVPLLVDADPVLLKIVLVNLVGNGVKYGREGGVVRIRAVADNETLRVVIRNDGPGFAAADRGQLFRKFSRLDDPELKKRKGTGVGLYTVWRLVKLHGGEVDARAEQGAWAEFSFSVPRSFAGDVAVGIEVSRVRDE